MCLETNVANPFTFLKDEWIVDSSSETIRLKNNLVQAVVNYYKLDADKESVLRASMGLAVDCLPFSEERPSFPLSFHTPKQREQVLIEQIAPQIRCHFRRSDDHYTGTPPSEKLAAVYSVVAKPFSTGMQNRGWGVICCCC